MSEQIAVDEYNQNLYFTESHLKLIGVCSINGTGCTVLVSGLDKPRGIAIHHRTRHIFYSDWGAKPAVMNLVDKDLQWPNHYHHLHNQHHLRNIQHHMHHHTQHIKSVKIF